MAPKKAIAHKPSSSAQDSFILQLIRYCSIPDSIKIRSLAPKEENRWRISGLGDDNLLALGKRHIKTIRLPIHPTILQFLFALQIHPMQLTPNSLKFIVAAIILNEVEGKGITVNDLLFIFNVKKTPSKLNSPKQHLTYYLSASKKYFMFFGKLAVDKDWETTGGLYAISGEWIPLNFGRTNFPLVNKFTQSKYCCSVFLL